MKTLSILLGSVLMLMANLVFAAMVNINTADWQTMADQLSGIGPAKAKAIVQYREADADGFKTKDELLNVSGIGPKTLEAIRDQITLGDTE